MSERAILNAIDDQTSRRSRAWSQRDTDEARAAGARLEELYEELRVERARQRSGPREEITRRARIELELEKLAEA